MYLSQGIGTGIGSQAMGAETVEWSVQSGSVKKRSGAREALGACCAGCASGHGCSSRDALGATSFLSRLGITLRTPVVASPGASPGVSPGTFPVQSGGVSPIVKLLLLAGVAVGGVVVYRKIKNRK